MLRSLHDASNRLSDATNDRADRHRRGAPATRWVSIFVRPALLVTLAALVAACAGIPIDDRAEAPIPAELMRQMAERGMSPADPILIRIYKKESELEVWKRDSSGRYALLKKYPLCRWSGKLGPKKQEGDRQAPEGFYSVTAAQLNPRSQYYLSFNLGYPNRLEQALGYEGSALMVHGACTSSGCFAMTNAGVTEVYALAREALAAGQAGFQVQSLPFRMTPRNFALHREDPNIAFWQNLKEGTDIFAVTKVPPRVSACGGRYRFYGANETVTTEGNPLAPCQATPNADADETSLIARHRFEDATAIARLSQSEPAVRSAYADGGMHSTFRQYLRRFGPQKLASVTSANIEVSQPDAALADPFVGPDDSNDPE